MQIFQSRLRDADSKDQMLVINVAIYRKVVMKLILDNPPNLVMVPICSGEDMGDRTTLVHYSGI